MIKLKEIVESIPSLKEGGKLFGSRAQRVSTADMNIVFNDLQKKIGSQFNQFKLSKALPSKTDHGDIDIVVSGNPNIHTTLENALGKALVDFHRNGNIYSALYFSDSLDKTVHVDFISATPEGYSAQYDYLSYNDFSGILGIIARKLHFNYGSLGFFKIYIDKNKRYHYILITKNLREGLVILGYKHVLSQFDNIQNIQDIVNFIASSDLFDSSYLESFGMNSSDRKRSRSERPTARAIRDGLLNLHKHRKIEDDDYFLKKEFPNYYQKVMTEIENIKNKTVVKSKYGGEWLMKNFPEIKPGPMIGKIKSIWQSVYGNRLDSVPEEELLAKTKEFLK